MNHVKNMSHIVIDGDYWETNLRNMLLFAGFNLQVEKLDSCDNQQVDCLMFRKKEKISLHDPIHLDSMIRILSSASDLVIINGDTNGRIKRHLQIKKRVSTRIVTYGFLEGVDIRAINVLSSYGKTDFDLVIYQELAGHVSFPIVGKENLYDLLACISYLYNEGYTILEIERMYQKYPCQVVYKEHGYELLVENGSVQIIQAALEQFYDLDNFCPIIIKNDSVFDLHTLNMAQIATVVYAMDSKMFQSKLDELKNMKYHLLELK